MLTPVEPPPEPSETLADPRELLVGYLEFYRDAILRKLDGMPDEELRRSRLPSGWTPLELLKHLAGVERRWFRWGFAAERLDSPWVEGGPGDPWRVGAEESADDVKALFLDECARSRWIVAGARLDDQAAIGGRFGPDDPRPTLAWTLFHVLQEYDRHPGHAVAHAGDQVADGQTSNPAIGSRRTYGTGMGEPYDPNRGSGQPGLSSRSRSAASSPSPRPPARTAPEITLGG